MKLKLLGKKEVYPMIHNLDAWNVRGAHCDIKLDRCKEFTLNHNLKLLAILKTKLNGNLTSRVMKYIIPQWSLSHNLNEGTYNRVRVIYDPFYLHPLPYNCHQTTHSLPYLAQSFLDLISPFNFLCRQLCCL